MIAPPVIATLLAACVAIEPSPRFDRDVALLGRSDRFDAAESLPASAFVTVVAKFGSSPSAAAN